MNIQQHARLCRFFNLYRLAAPLVMFALFPLPNALLYMGLIIAAHLVLLNLGKSTPLSCSRPGCGGRGQASNERLSFWKAALRYTCNECGKTHRLEIFNPRIEDTCGLP